MRFNNNYVVNVSGEMFHFTMVDGDTYGYYSRDGLFTYNNKEYKSKRSVETVVKRSILRHLLAECDMVGTKIAVDRQIGGGIVASFNGTDWNDGYPRVLVSGKLNQHEAAFVLLMAYLTQLRLRGIK